MRFEYAPGATPIDPDEARGPTRSMRHVCKLAIVVSVVLSALLLSVAGAACVDDYSARTIAGEFKRSAYVVLGKPISTTLVPESSDHYFLSGQNFTIRILELFKGPPARTLTVFSEYTSGQFPMKLNKSYILFLYREHGRLSVDNCGHSGPAGSSYKVINTVRALSGRAAQRH